MAAPDLLDRMTQLLAYVGDEGAQDGYPGATFRDEPLTPYKMNTLIAVIIKFLNDVEDTEYKNMPDDIKFEVTSLKNMFDEATNDEKTELLNYLRDYQVNDYPVNRMNGGRRRNNKNRRNTKKRRNNKKKTRRNRH